MAVTLIYDGSRYLLTDEYVHWDVEAIIARALNKMSLDEAVAERPSYEEGRPFVSFSLATGGIVSFPVSSALRLAILDPSSDGADMIPIPN